MAGEGLCHLCPEFFLNRQNPCILPVYLIPSRHKTIWHLPSRYMMSQNLKIFIILFLAVFVTTMGAGLVAPLLPVYAHELGAGAFQIGLIFAAFSLTRSLFVPYFGKLSDKKGRKPFLTLGLFFYFLLSLIYAVTNSVVSLIILRLGQGFASAMILPVAQAYVGDITPSTKEGWMMGNFNISIYCGLSIGPLLGGVLKDWFSITVSFLGMGCLTLFGFFLCLFLLPKEESLGIPNPSPRKQSVPYMEMMKDPAVSSLFLFRVCFTICVGITWAFIPLLASTKLGLSSSEIGLVVMINVMIAGLLQAPMGYGADHYSKKFFVASGGVLAITALLCLERAHTFLGLLLANAFFGVGGGVSLPAIMALAVIEGRRTKAMGSIMGLLAQAHSLGMLIGPLLAGFLLDIGSFKIIFGVGAVIMVFGTGIFFVKYTVSPLPASTSVTVQKDKIFRR